MVAIRDVVEISKFAGQRWAVLGPLEHDIPPGRLWRLRRDGEMLGRRRAQGPHREGDIVVLEHPQFIAGQLVHYQGGTAEVLADNGATVRIRYQQLHPPNLDRQLGCAPADLRERRAARRSGGRKFVKESMR
jgi:hypothetical protein